GVDARRYGGGGGGYYGGGGSTGRSDNAYIGGGGGGSGYIGGVTDGGMSSGVRAGHGLVVITFEGDPEGELAALLLLPGADLSGTYEAPVVGTLDADLTLPTIDIT